jgi:PhnB protein
MTVKPIPDGYRTLTPYLVVDDAVEAIEYYKNAFGANELVRMEAPGGKIGHAELEIGDALVMLSDPLPQFSTRPPKELGGTSVSVFMYVEDVIQLLRLNYDRVVARYGLPADATQNEPPRRSAAASREER